MCHLSNWQHRLVRHLKCLGQKNLEIMQFLDTDPPLAQQPNAGQTHLILEVSRSRNETPQSVGILWTRDRPVAETSTGQYTTLTRDSWPCTWRVSNPQPQQAIGCRPSPKTVRPLESARYRKWLHFFFRKVV